MSLPTGPAGRHRAVAGAFSDRVRGVHDWDAPSPVAGWTARDVVGHLLDWFPPFLADGGGHRLTGGADRGGDTATAWIRRARANTGRASRSGTTPPSRTG